MEEKVIQQRKGTKRRTINGKSEDQEFASEGDMDVSMQPARRRSARLIAISKPNLLDGNENNANLPKKGKGCNAHSSASANTIQKANPNRGLNFVAGPLPSSSFNSSSMISHISSSIHPSNSSINSTPISSSNKRILSTNCINATSHKKLLIERKSPKPALSSDDAEEDEWEAMEILHQKTEKQVLEVQLAGKAMALFKHQRNPLEDRDAKNAKEREKWEHEIKLELMRKRRELQENLHRVHFLAYIGHLQFMASTILQNKAFITEKFKDLFDYTSTPMTPTQMHEILKVIFKAKLCHHDKAIHTTMDWCINEESFIKHLLSIIDRRQFSLAREIALLFFAYCSFMLQMNTRICIAFSPIARLLDEPSSVSKKTKTTGEEPNNAKIEGKKKAVTKKLNPINKKKKMENNEEEDREEKCTSDDDQDDDHFVDVRKPKRRMRKETRPNKKQERKNNIQEHKPIGYECGGIYDIYWTEYWDEVDRRWICVDPFHESIDNPNQIETDFRLISGVKGKILYVLAIDNERGIREIGAKYVNDYLKMATRKLRTDSEWIKNTLELESLQADDNRARLEDIQIRAHLNSKPMPTNLSEFKNHPLYVLKKDLLKFEAIYPSDTQPIGYIGKQKYEVYPRSAVHKLEGSLNWIKESRSIKNGEIPYKVVSARPKLNIPKEQREPLTLDLFGYWQTEPYVPAEVTPDGRIPRNEFGNIYMYKEDMLPKGCVHLRLAGLYLLARRLDLEAVPAVVGWEFSGGFNHPILDGCVVLRKDEEVLRSAWQEMARQKAAKEAKKASERAWKNWRRLIRGKMLLEQMRKKFNSN